MQQVTTAVEEGEFDVKVKTHERSTERGAGSRACGVRRTAVTHGHGRRVVQEVNFP